MTTANRLSGSSALRLASFDGFRRIGFPLVAFAPEGEGGGGNGGQQQQNGGDGNNRAVVDMNADGGGSSQAFVVDVGNGLLTGDNLTAATNKGWFKDGKLDVSKALDSYRAAESQLGKSITPPSETATPEERSAFYAKLGRPEKATDYGITFKREGVPEGFAYDEAAAAEFANWAHETGLNKSQAQALHDKFVGHQAAKFGTAVEDYGKAEAAAFDDLAKSWGGADSDGYKRNLEMTSRAVAQLGIKSDLVAAGILSKDGQIRNPGIAKALAKVGSSMFAEDSYSSTGQTPSGSNPFDRKGNDYNLTKQGQLVRSDPAKAAAFIRQLGENPADYGLKV